MQDPRLNIYSDEYGNDKEGRVAARVVVARDNDHDDYDDYDDGSDHSDGSSSSEECLEVDLSTASEDLRSSSSSSLSSGSLEEVQHLHEHYDKVQNGGGVGHPDDDDGRGFGRRHDLPTDVSIGKSSASSSMSDDLALEEAIAEGHGEEVRKRYVRDDSDESKDSEEDDSDEDSLGESGVGFGAAKKGADSSQVRKKFFESVEDIPDSTSSGGSSGHYEEPGQTRFMDTKQAVVEKIGVHDNSIGSESEEDVAEDDQQDEGGEEDFAGGGVKNGKKQISSALSQDNGEEGREGGGDEDGEAMNQRAIRSIMKDSTLSPIEKHSRVTEIISGRKHPRDVLDFYESTAATATAPIAASESPGFNGGDEDRYESSSTDSEDVSQESGGSIESEESEEDVKIGRAPSMREDHFGSKGTIHSSDTDDSDGKLIFVQSQSATSPDVGAQHRLGVAVARDHSNERADEEVKDNQQKQVEQEQRLMAQHVYDGNGNDDDESKCSISEEEEDRREALPVNVMDLDATDQAEGSDKQVTSTFQWEPEPEPDVDDDHGQEKATLVNQTSMAMDAEAARKDVDGYHHGQVPHKVPPSELQLGGDDYQRESSHLHSSDFGGSSREEEDEEYGNYSHEGEVGGGSASRGSRGSAGPFPQLPGNEGRPLCFGLIKDRCDRIIAGMLCLSIALFIVSVVLVELS